MRIDSIRYGEVVTDSSAGESIVVCRTSSDRYELHCHGGKIAAQMILESMSKSGIVIESDIDWCLRDQQDPFVADAIIALAQARTIRTTRILLDQQRGALTRAFAQIDSAIDQGNLAAAKGLVADLQQWDHVGRHLLDPFEIIICGPPNVGKSSLMNRLLGYHRAIVHEQAGTTRDLLVEPTSIDGWPVRLTDSAGIRLAADAIERIGVERAIAASADADLQLLLVDPEQGWTDEHKKLFLKRMHQTLIVVTKEDRCIAATYPSNEQLCLPRPGIRVSALSGAGIPELMSAISASLVPIQPPVGQAVLFTESQRKALIERGFSFD